MTLNIGLQYLADGFTTLVDLRWRFTILVFSASFLFSWFGFALLWHLIFWAHGDLEPENLPPLQVLCCMRMLYLYWWSLQEAAGWTPCVFEIYDFTSSFLYRCCALVLATTLYSTGSVETQHTIGYGLRGSSHKCPDAVALQCLQSILGVIIQVQPGLSAILYSAVSVQACMAGIVFVKLSRPKRRARTVLFSRQAVVTRQHGLLRLQCRVANVRSSQLLESHIKGILLSSFTTAEGNTIK